jgi:hypothetical protein
MKQKLRSNAKSPGIYETSAVTDSDLETKNHE